MYIRIFIMHVGAFYAENAARPNQPTGPPPALRPLTSSVHGPPFPNPHGPTHTPRPLLLPIGAAPCPPAASVWASAVGRPVAARNPSCGARRNPRVGDLDAQLSPRLRAGSHIYLLPQSSIQFPPSTISPSDSRAAAGPLLHSEAGSRAATQ
jgi:hypothetical protein